MKCLEESSNCPGTEKHARENGTQELVSCAACAMHDEHCVRHAAAGVALRSAQRGVMETQLRQRLAITKMKIVNHEIAFVCVPRLHGCVGVCSLRENRAGMDQSGGE